jgi:proteasome lid subunit RPN8/RPN11
MTGAAPRRDPAVAEPLVWSVSGHSLSIEYLPTILEEIRAYATDGFNRIRHGGIEVGGVLFGVKSGDCIRIFGWRALDCEHAEGPGFVLSDNDEAALRVLSEESRKDPKLNGLEPVGWFHSHTRSGIFLSDSDLRIYERHFPHPWQIAMLLRPSQLGPAEVGFFFREQDGKINNQASYNTFTVDPLPPAPSVKPDLEAVSIPQVQAEIHGNNQASYNTFTVDPLRPPGPSVKPDPEPVSIRQAQAEIHATPAFKRAALKSFPTPRLAAGASTKWLWLATSFVLAALGIAALSAIFHEPGESGGNPALNLRAYDHAGQVRIEWDRSAEPVLSARKASLFITDGDQMLETEVSPNLLHHGSMVYQRKTSNVEIRLWVKGAESAPVQEWTKLIGLNAAPLIPIEGIDAGDRTSPSAAGTPAIKAGKTRKSTAITRKSVSEPVPEETLKQSAPEKPVLEGSPRASIAIPAVASPDRSMSLERQIAAPKPSWIYNGPATGRLIWTGNLNSGASLEIDGDRASTGDLTGSLPNVAVRISVHPASFSRRGMDVFASELDAEKEIREQPSANNGWTQTVYKRNLKRAGDVVVTQNPSVQNRWKKIGLRAAGRKVSVIVVDWEVIQHGQ